MCHIISHVNYRNSFLGAIRSTTLALALTVAALSPATSALAAQATQRSNGVNSNAANQTLATQPSHYTPLWCPTNIYFLVRDFARFGFDVASMRVLYIFGDADADGSLAMIHPHAARGSTTQWSFHVVLEYRGIILDPDFDNQPRMVHAVDYFEKMWSVRPGKRGIESLFVRSIAALEYLRDYENNWQHFLFEHAAAAQPAEAWLSAHR